MTLSTRRSYGAKPIPDPRTGWPTPIQELLVRAGTGHGQEVIDAWTTLRPNLDLDTLDLESTTVLPLVYRNLVAHEMDDPDLPRLRGIYRHSWSRNQFLVHSMGLVVEALAAKGVGTIVLKGVALASLYYADPGTRPMADIDVLIKPEDAPVTLAHLAHDGWSVPRLRVEPIPRFLHGVEVTTQDGTKLDVHWRPSPYMGSDGSHADMWSNARRFPLGATTAMALAPEEQLLHVCTHGVRSAPDPHLRWVVDSLMIIRVEEGFDWDRLVDIADKYSSSLPLRDALAYLQRFTEGIPSTVVPSLARIPRPRRETFGYQAMVRRRSRFALFDDTGAIVAHYARVTARWKLRDAFASVPQFFRESWGLDGGRSLLGVTLEKLRKRFRREPGGSPR